MAYNPKITTGKIDPTKVLPEFVLGVADIRMHGDEKYGKDSWKNVPREEWIAAAHRHLLELERGEIHNTKDWGHHHALHIACSMMFVEYLDTHGEIRPDDAIAYGKVKGTGQFSEHGLQHAGATIIDPPAFPPKPNIDIQATVEAALLERLNVKDLEALFDVKSNSIIITKEPVLTQTMFAEFIRVWIGRTSGVTSFDTPERWIEVLETKVKTPEFMLYCITAMNRTRGLRYPISVIKDAVARWAKSK